MKCKSAFIYFFTVYQTPNNKGIAKSLNKRVFNFKRKTDNLRNFIYKD